MSIVKKLSYEPKDNYVSLVNCLKKHNDIFNKIPHQPGEFSELPFKLTTTCLKNKVGDYYNYYNNCFKLNTTKNNITTKFNNIVIKKFENVVLKKIEVELSIHKRYVINNLKTETNIKGFSLLFCGIMTWGEFMQDYLPYLFFCKDLLQKNPDISILIHNTNLFDSFNYFIYDILKLKNKIITIDVNQKIELKEFYEVKCNGPFSSGLFPYQGHCTCPIILYKNLYHYIHNDYLKKFNYEKKRLIIYTKRNTGNKIRNVINENKIIKFLELYCKKFNYNFLPFYYNDFSIDERIKLFNQASIVVGIHGSANFHTLFCNSKVKVIEFICVKDCHSTELINLSYGFNYWQIPIKEYGQFEEFIYVKLNLIKSLYEILISLKN